jgi:hypothetical protein
MLHMHIYIYKTISNNRTQTKKKVTHGVFPAQTNLQQEMQTSDAKCIGADAQHTNASSHHPTASPHHVWWIHCETGKRRGHDTCGSRGGGRERVLHNNRFCVRLLENCCFGCLTLLLYTTQTSRYIMYIGFVCWVSLSTGIHVKLTFNKSLYHESKIALPFPLICLSLFGWLGLDLYMNQ